MQISALPPSEVLHRVRWPSVVLAAALGLTPHILLLYSSAPVRLTTIVIIHAVVVPAFTWIALWRLEQRARHLEAANAELRHNAQSLSRRNEQIDALNTACRLLAGTPSVAAVLRPLTHLTKRVSQAAGVTLIWGEDQDEQTLTETAGLVDDSADNGSPDASDTEATQTIDLVDADRHLGSIHLIGAEIDDFTRKSTAVLASEIGLTWRLRHIEGNTLSALSATSEHALDLDADKQAQRLLAVVSDAVEATGAGLYVLRSGEWELRASHGSVQDTPLEIPEDGTAVWYSNDQRTLFLKGAADGVLALHGIANTDHAARALNFTLLRIVAGHSASLLRVADTYKDLLWGERMRIARELHDDVCQNLASLHMQLGHLSDLIADGREEEAAARTKELRADAINAYDAARRAVDGFHLKPSSDEDAGHFLAHIAQSTCKRLGAELKTDMDPLSLGAESTWQLGRIVQEAITNAARHGEARNIEINLRAGNGTVELTVDDDGRGLGCAGEESAVMNGHHGLAIMRERVAALEGNLEITNTSQGTRLIARVPSLKI